MANLKFGNTNIGKISIIEPYESTYVETETPTQPYVRPAHFLDLPVINSGEHKCAILYAISSGDHPENIISNYTRGIQNPSNGGQYFTDYTIDWGDGTSDSVNTLSASVPTHYHEYDFNNLDPSTEFNKNGFKFRQALMVVTANSGIERFTWQGYYVPLGAIREEPLIPVLDMNLNLPSGKYTGVDNYSRARMPYLKEATVYMPNSYGFNSFFRYTNELEKVTMYSGEMPNLTGVNQMFYESYLKIENYPKIDTSNVLSAFSFAQFANAGKSFPSGLYDFSSCKNMVSFFYRSNFEEINIDISSLVTGVNTMFSQCYNLKKITGNWDTSNVTNMDSMFDRCFELQTMPNIDFSSTINCNLMFQLNRKNRSLPKVLDAPNCPQFWAMFNGAYELETIKFIAPTVNVTRLDSMFSSAINLKNIEIEGTFKQTYINYGMNYMFSSCSSLEKAPYFNQSGIRNMAGLFNSCSNLKYVPQFNTSGVTNFSSMFYDCRSLKSIPKLDFSGTGIGSVNIADMFRSCSYIENYPDFDLSNVYYGYLAFNGVGDAIPPSYSGINLDLSSMSASYNNTNNMANSMFNYMPIKTIDSLVIGSGARLYNTFYNCDYLESIPYADVSLANDMTACFNNCFALKVGALSGTACNIGYNRCGLGSGAVVDVFNGFGTVSSATADMRYNPGMEYISQADLDIALNKGWTVLT